MTSSPIPSPAPSPTPRRVTPPSWFDLRLVLGVALVLASVLIGARVVASTDDSTRVLAVTRDVAAGTLLTGDDVTPVSVRVTDGLYLPAGSDLSGLRLNRPLARGELLPRSALGTAPALTTLTLPLAAGQAPSLAAGQRIRVWVSTKTCASVVLLADATVQRVADSEGGSFAGAAGQDVTLSLPAEQAARVVGALSLPDVSLRAGVLTGPADAASAAVPPLDACAAPMS